jgi:hypothetical protein
VAARQREARGERAELLILEVVADVPEDEDRLRMGDDRRLEVGRVGVRRILGGAGERAGAGVEIDRLAELASA